jgi:hypothetical protein
MPIAKTKENAEIILLAKTLKKCAIDLKIVNKMDSKSIKHMDLYQALATEHSKNNYNRTAPQIKSKFKQLRLNYVNNKSVHSISGAGGGVDYIYDLLKELFGDRPRKQLDARSKNN